MRSVTVICGEVSMGKSTKVFQTLTIKPRHQNDTINTHLPLLRKHKFGLLPKGPRSFLMPILLVFEKLLGLGEAAADQADTD